KRAGEQVSIVTTSGTNQVHGDVFEYLRNSVLDARNFFDRSTGRRIPPFERNQFGGALGGPLKKDKLFLFGNYEGFRQRLGISSVSFVPDANARLGLLPPAGDPLGTPVPVAGLEQDVLPDEGSVWPATDESGLGGGGSASLSNAGHKVAGGCRVTCCGYNVS